MAEQQKENTVFQTGSTQPPKSYQGVIALLLVLVVILGGVVTMLSMMNIRLFQMLADSQQEELSFETDPYEASPASLHDGYIHPQLGMVLQEVDDVYQSYMKLPEGLYICQVLEEGYACRVAFRSGDILTAVNGYPITDLNSLHTLLEQHGTVFPLQLTVVRDGSKLNAQIPKGD